jgi:LPPG:FO 2-phospho-L-lactate transferase
MSDDPVRTRVRTDAGWQDFQDYFVRQQCRPAVRELEFAGAGAARAQPEALAALNRPDLAAIVICPSNPWLSVAPILAVPALRAAIEQSAAPVLAVTPIVGGRALRGPAAKIMAELGLGAGAEAVARWYGSLIDVFVYDVSDAPPAAVSGVELVAAPTLMQDAADRLRLARTVLDAARNQRSSRSSNTGSSSRGGRP